MRNVLFLSSRTPVVVGAGEVSVEKVIENLANIDIGKFVVHGMGCGRRRVRIRDVMATVVISLVAGRLGLSRRVMVRVLVERLLYREVV